MIETTIERVSGDTYCNVYTGERKFVNKILELHKQYPDEVIITDYGDGYLSAHVPYNWFRFIKSPTKRNYTEEQRKAMGERMKKARENKTQG